MHDTHICLREMLRNSSVKRWLKLLKKEKEISEVITTHETAVNGKRLEGCDLVISVNKSRHSEVLQGALI